VTSSNGRAPVLAGAGLVTQHTDDPVVASDAFDLMVRGARDAVEDSGCTGLLDHVGWIGVPLGSWPNPGDPGRLVAEELGLANVHTVLADIGVPQQTLITDAVRAVAAGETDAALVVGAEARYRDQRAKAIGVTLPPRAPVGSPDQWMKPASLGIHDLELELGFATPYVVYALIEDAIAAASGATRDEHVASIGELWAGMAEVARDNPHAWDRSAPDAGEIVTPSAANRMLATPYTKQLCSQWTVDQAAALLVCSAEIARSAGVAEDRLVYPVSAAESVHDVPVLERAELHRCPGAAAAGERALALAGTAPDELTHVELYSCFPAAVELYGREIGIPLAPAPTVTGGMTFGGGPFNSFVLQATAEMARVLRDDPGTALVSTVSGFLHKQAVALWSSQPATHGFRAEDVSDEAARRTATRPAVGGHEGPATVVAATVVHAGGRPAHAYCICDVPDGRALAMATEPELLAELERGASGRVVGLRDGAAT